MNPRLSPRLIKGTLTTEASGQSPLRTLSFQFNPSQIARTISPRTGEDSKWMHFKGIPKETLNFTAQFDATEAMSEGIAQGQGIYPQLSTLELMLYPSSTEIMEKSLEFTKGTIEVIPPETPLTLFTWGVNRVLPVRIDSFSVTENGFDVNLNPIRAEVSINLTVLSYNEAKLMSKTFRLFYSYHAQKEFLART